jgi:two-component system nitrogen regulation sensor histidine kinase GlnL
MNMAMQSRPLAEAVLSSLSHPVIALDEQDRIIYVNPAGEEFFRSSQGILRGMPLSGFIDGDHAIFEMIKRSRNSHASVSDQGIDIDSPRLGQRLVNIQVSVSPSVGADADSPQVVVAMQEHTLVERLRGHDQFRGAARSMSSLSGLLAHEIKNPLGGIRGAAELLQHNGTEDSHELTDLIIVETDRIAALLTRMESLAGGRAIAPKPVNIHEVINHCIRLAQNSFGRDRQIISRFDPSLPTADGDRDLLIQAFINLIKNACEATENNGIIEIITSYNLEARLAIPPLTIEILDNGVGIAQDLQEHIFDPFVTDKLDGRGFGLVMVASTIADHGGTIDVNSIPGATSFKIGLPMTPDKIRRDDDEKRTAHSAFR